MANERLTMSIAEVAKELGVSKPTAYKIAKQHGFPAVQVSENRIVVVRSKFVEWLEANIGNVVCTP